MKKIIAFVLVMILLPGCIKVKKSSSKENEEFRADSLRQVEALIQDSIKQEELYRSFTSPDLEMFNLHGHVQSVTYTSEMFFPSFYGGLKSSINFDTEGRCTNIKDLFQKSVGENGNVQVSRNEKNQIIELNLPNLDYPFEYKFGWSDGHLISCENSVWESYSDMKIFYENDVPESVSEKGGVEGMEFESNATYSNFVYDEMGNWISCDYKFTTKSWDFDSPYDVETQHFNETIKRKITYYPR